jgi:hypothetical protein
MSTSLKGKTRVVRLSDLMKLRRFMVFVVPGLSKSTQGRGAGLAQGWELRLQPDCGWDGRMVRPAGLVIPAMRPEWMVGRRDVLIPAHQPADQRLGFCLARTALSTPSWPGIRAVRQSLGLFLSQLHDASGGRGAEILQRVLIPPIGGKGVTRISQSETVLAWRRRKSKSQPWSACSTQSSNNLA